MTRVEEAAGIRLLQLASPALPVGAYAYSEALEHAVETGWVRDEAGLADWLEGILGHVLARLDLPLLARMHRAFAAGDDDGAGILSARLVASRETAELRAADRDLGRALARLLDDLGIVRARSWRRRAETSYAAMHALAGVEWHIGPAAGAGAYAFAWAENLVAVGLKLGIIGQTAGQRRLLALGSLIPGLVGEALAFTDDEVGAAAPGLAIASAAHETQHTRLFRS